MLENAEFVCLSSQTQEMMQKHLERKSKEGEEMRLVCLCLPLFPLLGTNFVRANFVVRALFIYCAFTFIVLFLVRKLVEQTTMEHENTKEARRKLQEYNQKLGKVLMESLRRVTHNL